MVPQPGLYYVYAQTYFRHTHSLEEEEGGEQQDRGRPLLQYVYKKVRPASSLEDLVTPAGDSANCSCCFSLVDIISLPHII